MWSQVAYQITCSCFILIFYLIEISTLAARGSFDGQNSNVAAVGFRNALIVQAVANTFFASVSIAFMACSYGPSIPTNETSMMLALMLNFFLMWPRVIGAFTSDGSINEWLEFVIDFFGYGSLIVNVFMLKHSMDHWNKVPTPKTVAPKRRVVVGIANTSDTTIPLLEAAERGQTQKAIPRVVRRMAGKYSRVDGCAAAVFSICFALHMAFVAAVILSNILHVYQKDVDTGETCNHQNNSLHDVAANIEKTLVAVILEPFLGVLMVWSYNKIYKQGATETVRMLSSSRRRKT